MTHRAVVANGGVPRIWLLPLVTLAALVFLTASGLASRAIIADFLAWWPVWLASIILIVVTAGRRLGRIRLSGVVPIVVTACLVLFAIGHALGWPAMPSSVQRLVGPPPSPGSSAALSARVEGRINLTAGSAFLYEVSPIRRGGQVGVPTATEQLQGTVISVLLEAPADPGIYAYAGWEIDLSTESSWTLTLEGDVDADLTGLTVEALHVFGKGTVLLGAPGGAVPASVAGEYTLVVPPGTSARVVGDAVVPGSWDQLSDGARSPNSGDGWVISVPVGSAVIVTEG